MKKQRAFLKWAGGKYGLVEDIQRHLPPARKLGTIIDTVEAEIFQRVERYGFSRTRQSTDDNQAHQP